MANNDAKGEPSATYRFDWHGWCPWLILLRVFRISISFQLLLLATVGGIATTVGWRLSERMFVNEQMAEMGSRSEAERNYLTKWPGQRVAPGLPFDNLHDGKLAQVLVQGPADPVLSLPYRMILPFWRCIDRRVGWSELFYYLFAGFWTVAVWSFVGGMITRVAVLRLGRDERVDVWRAFEFGRSKWFAHFSGPLMPLVGVLLVAVPMAALGVVMRSNVGTIAGGLLWGAVIAGGFLMTLLLTSLLFGWPLMWAAISAEGTDGFDAISRSYSYTLQRPLHYFAYAVLAAVLGLLGWGVVWIVSESVIGLGYWGVSWGTGGARGDVLVGMIEPNGASMPTAGVAPATVRAGTRLIGIWTGLLRSLAGGYAYSYFWCATAAIYLLLRRSVDATELDEVHVDGEASAVFGLPKLKEGTGGVPDLEAGHLKPVEPLQTPPPRSSTDRND